MTFSLPSFCRVLYTILVSVSAFVVRRFFHIHFNEILLNDNNDAAAADDADNIEIPFGMVLMPENESLWFFVSFVMRLNWFVLRIGTRSRIQKRNELIMARQHAMPAHSANHTFVRIVFNT